MTDPMGGLRGMEHAAVVAMANECAAQAGIKDLSEASPEGWNLLHRLAHAASKHGAREREATLRALGEAPSEVTLQLIARDAHGRKKYGVSLDRTDFNVEDWLQHMAEEMMDGAGYALAAKRVLQSIPFVAIERCLNDAMNQAIANGANSVSMPDYTVELAGWLAGKLPIKQERRSLPYSEGSSQHFMEWVRAQNLGSFVSIEDLFSEFEAIFGTDSIHSPRPTPKEDAQTDKS